MKPQLMFKLHLTGIETLLNPDDRTLDDCSNCTLLELKLRFCRKTSELYSVQIAPYWN